MKITSINNDTGKNDRLSVYVDGKYSFSVSKKDFDNLSLHVDKEMYVEDITFIREKLNVNSAKFCAINFLSYKIRSEKEIVDKLIKKGFDDDTIESAIAELKSMGYINDKIYSRKYIYDKNKLRPLSKKMLKYNLVNKGISKLLADKVIEECALDDKAVAFILMKKKFGKNDLTDEKIIKKVFSFLSRKGLNYEDIKNAFETLKEEQPEKEDRSENFKDGV
ncbi:MAG: regulatory protein RecX [Clostridia bacterium]|jgi:regulatory protein